MRRAQDFENFPSSSDDLTELESHFILRLPVDAAHNVKQWLQENGDETFKEKLQISFNPDMRHAQVKVDKEIFSGTLMDLPCIIETLKTTDRKNFYKVADCPQILICKREDEDDVDIFKKTKNKKIAKMKESDKVDSADPKKKDKQYQYPHGITPPLKNVRKRRFRKTLKKKYMDAPELEKELKRLLRTDLEAVSVRWEMVTPEQEAQQKLRAKTASESSLTHATEEANTESMLEKYVPSGIREHDLFGGDLSSTSSSDDGEESAQLEGQAMARQLMASTDDEISKISASASNLDGSFCTSALNGDKTTETSFPVEML